MSSSTEPPRSGGRRLPWRALVVLVVVVLLGLLPLARNLLDRRDELLSTNTRAPVSPSAETVRPGSRTCTDVRRDAFLKVPEGTSAVRLFPGYTNLLAPRLQVVLSGSGTTVRGTGPERYATGAPLILGLDREVPKDLRRICVRNLGPSTVTLARAVDAGGNDRAVPLDQGGPDRAPRVRSTVRFDLIGRRDALAASLTGEGLTNAGAYKPDGVGPAVIGAGMVLVLLGGVLGIAFVLRTPDDDETGAPTAASGPRAASGDDGRGGW